MSTGHERVGKALDVLTRGLSGYVEDALKTIYRERWTSAARESFRDDRSQAKITNDGLNWDAHSLLTVMWDQWNSVFRHRLGQPERSLVSELRDFRNRWAHQEQFNDDDTYRALDSIQRLLTAVSAPEVNEVASEKRELLRAQFSEDFQHSLEQAELANRKWSAVAVLVVCCAFIVATLLQFLEDAWFLAAFVVIVFAYLVFQRLRFRPVVFGPRECERCGRIIYTDTCPYCSVNAAPERTV